MNNNPFGKHTFESVWLKHFKNSSKSIVFKSFKNISFYKDKYLPLYVNVGRNISNGMYYEIETNANDYKGRTFLIYDVPDYFDIKNTSEDIKVKKAIQYKGYSSQLSDFENFNDFFNAKFSSSSRYKYRRNIKRLESCFDINYKIYHEDVSREDYEHIFKHFKIMLSRRFGALGLDNNILSKWEYYYELIYKMVLEKEAVISVIYNDKTPIAVSIGFLSKEVFFFAITTFDIDYIKFNLGHTIIIKLNNWCYENGFKVFDFSKGKYDYKDRWANHEFDYECHILYDSKSVSSRIMATGTQSFFKIKQYLRDKKVNYLYSKLKYIFKNRPKKIDRTKYSILNIEEIIIDKAELRQVDIESHEYSFLKASLFDYLYNNPINMSDVKIHKSNSELFYAIGPNIQLSINKM